MTISLVIIIIVCICIAPSLFLFSLCQGWGGARNYFTASSDSPFHPPLSLVFFQSSFSPVFITPPPISALASLVSSCPPHVTLPLSSGILSSAILSTCPAHCNLLLASLSVKLLCTPSLPLTPPFFAYLPSLVLQFFVPSCFRTLAAFVVVVRSVSRFPFRTGMPVWHKCSWPCPLVFLRSAITPSTALDVFAPACTLRRIPSSRLGTLPLLCTRNCSPESVSSRPSRCPALPSGSLCAALPSSLG